MSVYVFLLLATVTHAKTLHESTEEVLPSVVPGRLLQEGESSLSMDLDSHGGIMRREDKRSQSLLEESSASKRDLYTIVGKNLCDGGGLWKRYEFNAVVPGKYEYCAAACDAKEECIGFDRGNTGCNLYTQKAVALGTWPNVRFNKAGAFDGKGSHDEYPKTPFDLTVGTSDFGVTEQFDCYRKTYYKAVDSYYWTIGKGTCSGGGRWKHYKKTDRSEVATSRSDCEDVCNQRDECIGFDIGAECSLYTQKAVHGTWWTSMTSGPHEGEKGHKDFAATPADLMVSEDQDNADASTTCYGKTHWVSLDSYYMELGKQTCTGGGKWKHYMFQGTLDECKAKCDSKPVCIGLDVVGTSCRLYTQKAVKSGSWEGVLFANKHAFSGEKDHDAFAPTAFSLSPGGPTAKVGTACFAKSHSGQ